MSTKKTIYLIRHGETDYNKRSIIQGSGIDSDLNEQGRKQAEQFHKAYFHLPFKAIYSSEMKRAVQTLEPFMSSGHQIQPMSSFNEISWGALEGRKTDKSQQFIYRDMLNDWKAGLLDRAVEGGESPRAMYNRQRAGLEYIMQRPEEDLILICMHGRAMRSFLCLLTGIQLTHMDTFKHSNLCLYVLEERKHLFEIITANSVDHLI